MYDIKKMVGMEDMTVSELIQLLSELPQDAVVSCCGDPMTFIHVEKDGSKVNIDNEDLEDVYIEDDETTPEEFFTNQILHKMVKLKPHFNKNDCKNMSLLEGFDLISNVALNKCVASNNAINLFVKPIQKELLKLKRVKNLFKHFEWDEEQGVYKYYTGFCSYCTDFGEYMYHDGSWITINKETFEFLQDEILKGEIEHE